MICESPRQPAMVGAVAHTPPGSRPLPPGAGRQRWGGVRTPEALDRHRIGRASRSAPRPRPLLLQSCRLQSPSRRRQRTAVLATRLTESWCKNHFEVVDRSTAQAPVDGAVKAVATMAQKVATMHPQPRVDRKPTPRRPVRNYGIALPPIALRGLPHPPWGRTRKQELRNSAPLRRLSP